MKRNEHPMTWQEFEQLYMLHLQAPDQPSAHIAYMRTESAVVHRYGHKKFSTYTSFRNMLSQQRKKKRTAAEPNDVEAYCFQVVKIANAYLSQLDLQQLQSIHKRLSDQARHLEAFGPLQPGFNHTDLNNLKRQAQALQALIQYISTGL